MSDYLTVFERRASAVLYRYLRGVTRPGTWLLPANVCPIVPAVYAKAGKTFEFADISPNTLCLDTTAAVARMRCEPGKFAGVLFVHTYGHPGDFEEFFGQLKSLDQELQVVDDRCLCQPCFSRLGGVAEIELYSSGYSKFVDMGWGGWGHLRKDVAYEAEPLPFDSAAQAQLMQTFRTTLKERTPFECPASAWLDARPPEITFEQFRNEIEARLSAIARHRDQLNRIYSQQLESWALPDEFLDWRFTIQCAQQRELLDAIFSAGHFASGHYISLIPMFGLGIAPIAEKLGQRAVNLFNDLRYTSDRATELSRLVLDHLHRGTT
jgi:hypothetical protein